MKAIFLVLLLPLLAKQEQTTREKLVDHKWYRSYTKKWGDVQQQSRKDVYSRPWIYFGDAGFFEDFQSAKQSKRGKWTLVNNDTGIRVDFSRNSVVTYRIHKLSNDTLELDTGGNLVIGLVAGNYRGTAN